MLTVNEMRKAIEKVYKGDKWKRQVAAMPDRQVIAVYCSFVQRGLVNG